MTNRHTLGPCPDCMAVRDRLMSVPTKAEQRARDRREAAGEPPSDQAWNIERLETPR